MSQTMMPFDQVTGLKLPDAALAYARSGFPVLPCWPLTKEPATRHGFKDATTDLEQVSYWWRRNPQANIAIATGRQMDVLDIDAHHTGSGFATLQRIFDAGHAREWAHAVRSRSGGLHLYYPADLERPQRSWSRALFHIDFRGTGGYILVPPSRVLKDGKVGPYEPVGQTFTGSPIRADLVREMLTPTPPVPPPRGPGLDGSTEVHAQRIGAWLHSCEGSDRNEALFWAACRLSELGLTEADTVTYLSEAAERIGVSHRATLATIRNAHRRTIPDLTTPTRHSGHTASMWRE